MAMVRFGDVAERVNTKEDRFNTDLVYYVGGDHIESNALTVSGRGKIKEADLGPMFYFGFKPGDILFVTRNPHLRKSAKVDFAGICSEKTLVIATKDENVLLQDYLAGVMQSDDFWDFMEENKSGSVNYFINWSTLADYEFDLPPLDRQRKLAELLWAANDLKESYKKAITATDEMLKAKFREMFGDTAGNSKNWPMPKFGDSLNGIENGKSFVCQTVPREGDYPAVLKLSAVTYGVYQPNENKAVLDESQYNPKIEVRTGDLLMTRKNTLELVGACAYVHETTPRLMLPDIVFRLDVKECYNKQFLWALLSHPDQRQRIQRIAGGTNTSMVNISKERLCNLPMVVPPLSLQREFVAIADKAESAKANLKKSIAAIDQVMKGLING